VRTQPDLYPIFDNADRFTRHHVGSKAEREKIAKLSFTVFEVTELREALLNLAKANLGNLKIMLLVDGLDEYYGAGTDETDRSGNQNRLVDLFKQLTSGANIKAVVSSRPESLFDNAFKQDTPFLKMEDLTKADMVKYICAELGSHVWMRELVAGDPKLLKKFARSVASQASGIFLWTSLAVKLLKEKLNSHCYPEELRTALYSYPTELKNLYLHMFARLSGDDRIEGYQILQCVYLAKKTEGEMPSLLRIWFMMSPSTSSLQSSIAAKEKLIGQDFLENNLRIMAKRLKSRTCDLLEGKWKPPEATDRY